MNKNDIIDAIRRYGAPDDYVGGGAAMVLLGLRDTTEDVDVSTSNATGFDARWAMAGRPTIEVFGTTRHFVVRDGFDLHLDNSPPGQRLYGVGCRVATRAELLDFYLRLNRPKDQKWIAVLQ